MTSITTTIQDAAPRHKELLGVLSETDHAPPSLEHQKEYISDLERDMKGISSRLADLQRQREKELKEHEKYRKSVMKRFAYKVARKQERFEEKASKEEQDYLKVLQDIHKTEQEQESVKGMRVEALEIRDKLEQETARHEQAQRDLDGLYNSIFEGPTPEFPEEDATERRVQTAAEACRSTRRWLESEQKAASLLNQAKVLLGTALRYMEDALDYSRWDMFGGGTMADMMERDALHNSENQVHQAQMLVVQAQRYSSEVRALPEARISHGNLMGDVLFDNIFSDMEFHDKIKASREEVRRCATHLDYQIQQAGMRVQQGEVEITRLSQELSDARVALQKARESIFERLAGTSSGSSAEGISSSPGPSVPPNNGTLGGDPPDTPSKDSPPTPPKDGPSNPPPTPPKDTFGGNPFLPPKEIGRPSEPPPPYSG